MLTLTDTLFSELRHTYELKTRAYIEDSQRVALVVMLEGSDFKEFVGKWLQLCIHMVLSDPRITVSFGEFLEYGVLSRPEEYYCIDGFPKGNPTCVTVLPPPIRNSAVYQGIKPAVLILPKEQGELNHEEQKGMLRSEEDSMEMTSPLALDMIPHLAIDGLLESEEAQPETPISFRKSKESTYMQKYEQKQLSRSPKTRKLSPHKEASPKDVMALYHHFKNSHRFDSKSKRTDDDPQPLSSRYSTMPLQVRKSPFARGDKPIKPLTILNLPEAGQKSSRKSIDETPSSTQRVRQLCPNCKTRMPCHRCEGTRTFTVVSEGGYTKPSRTHSSSLLEAEQDASTSGGRTTLMKKRQETANRAVRQKEGGRPKEPCKMM